jgi:hypothetical protein
MFELFTRRLLKYNILFTKSNKEELYNFIPVVVLAPAKQIIHRHYPDFDKVEK